MAKMTRSDNINVSGGIVIGANLMIVLHDVSPHGDVSAVTVLCGFALVSISLRWLLLNRGAN